MTALDIGHDHVISELRIIMRASLEVEIRELHEALKHWRKLASQQKVNEVDCGAA